MFENPYVQQYGYAPRQQMPNYYSQQSMQQNVMQLYRVNGYEGAKAFQMPPNSQAALFDMNEDIFYLKASDSAGFATIDIYDFSKHKAVAAPTADEFITRKEFDEKLKEIFGNGKQHIRKQTANASKQPVDSDFTDIADG